MSLARAFTTRKAKKVAEISAPLPQRSNTNKHTFASGTIRNKISGPMELLSTTNMLSYNAPDLFPTAQASPPLSSPPPSLSHSSSSSTHSVSSNGETSASTPPTSPESSGRSPSPNHLSCYFEKPSNSDVEDVSAPSIPQRSPSHTKRTHEIVHRKRSISRMSQNASHSVKTSITSLTRDSMQMFSATPELLEDSASYTPHTSISSTPSPNPTPAATFHSKKLSHSQPNHPFGSELAQVTELAEEYAGVEVVEDEERDLISRGFLKWDARDYLMELEGLYETTFTEQRVEWF